MDEKRIPIRSLGSNVAANIHRIRTQRRITYTEMTQQLTELGNPIPVLGLQRIVQLKRRVDVDDLVAIAAVLGVNEPWSLTQLWECETCHGAPPPGYTCNGCGKTAT